ncbi:MAG: beta-hydroxyacyl-ACP dehydratase [Planctomycetaceae bacterium]|nr:beta-hydroxyacyl-ACP dehydratase [Planctomycetales bacterium]MCB9925876.1 beta-hydroxyacyl-ACP dehydratase [Planctomycetaceae bacterium]
MRWFWIDKFIEFESGRRAVATKNVSLVEDQMDRYGPFLPLMPASLIIEGLAQTGGLLVGEHNAFKERVVLAKLGKAVFHRPALAGDTLTYTAVVESIQSDGAICKGTSHIGDQLHAEVELVFAHLDDRFQGVDLFEPADFLRMLRLLRLFEVGRTESGEPLKIPDHLLNAERDEFATSR